MATSTAHNDYPNENRQIAETILQQLGGRRFLVMTGARNLMAIERGLSFSLPTTANFVKNGINRVSIKLTGADLYDIEYARSRGTSYKPVTRDDGIYADMLQQVFTRTTGLDTHL